MGRFPERIDLQDDVVTPQFDTRQHKGRGGHGDLSLPQVEFDSFELFIKRRQFIDQFPEREPGGPTAPGGSLQVMLQMFAGHGKLIHEPGTEPAFGAAPIVLPDGLQGVKQLLTA